MEPCGVCQPATDQIDLARWRGDAPLRFLLEGVEHIDRLTELRGVHGPVGVRVMEIDDFHHTDATKASQGFCRGICLAALRCIESFAHVAAYVLREASQIRA
jgi:hypothetical protein